ncbi:MAG: hypothetical protein H6510_00205 [Acidobacteria bacterium]|nr:hypothetical protein [Acidobacteriota bacterium]MCB9396209.1 hypothetical protein [Acidobacteriota bacterium]
MFNRRNSYRSSDSGKKPIRWIILLGLVLGLVWYGHKSYIDRCLRMANQYLSQDDMVKSKLYFQKAANFPLSKGIGLDGLAGLSLIEGELDQARDYFQKAQTARPGRDGVDAQILLTHFLENGQYAEGKIYRDYLMGLRPLTQLQNYLLDFAALSLGNRELAEARRMLTNALPQDKQKERYKTLLNLADEYERQREIPVVLDRAGQTIVCFDLNKGDYVFVTPNLFTGWPSPAESQQGGFLKTLEKRDSYNEIVTTIDLNVQKSAYQAMRQFEGSLVALNPYTGEVLAAYGSKDKDPFTWTFEPGSVIKLLTYGTFLQNQGDPSKYAPASYPSSKNIDGQVFYDWTTHGMIRSVDEGMAVSCNLMFAQMGIDLGLPKLQNTFGKVFDNQIYTSFFSAATPGKILKTPSNAFEVGRFSIGLDYIQATSLGIAQIPMIVANAGSLQEPRLLDHFVTLEGLTYKTIEPKLPQKVFGDQVVLGLFSSMREAVENERGTARRAKTEFVDSALKTGTAGESPYDAIMVGLVPAQRPQIAFAFCLHKGGKSEINGARVADAFLEHLRVLAPKYLEHP